MEETLKQQTALNPDCLRVVFYGPESTGKSVMAKQLSQVYSEPYVQEYSRIYAEEKRREGLQLTKEDVLPIARGQIQLENEQLKYAKKLLICDTDLLQTKVYSEQYYKGFCPPEVAKYALTNQYDCYFLCSIDTVWEEDGIRDRPDQRQEMFDAFKEALIDSKKTFIILRGTFEEKIEACREKIIELLKYNL